MRIRNVTVVALLVTLAMFGTAWRMLAASALEQAVRSRDIGAVRTLLLKSKSEVNSKTADGSTLLHFAVDANDVALTELLLGAGANASAPNRYGVTPLMIASQLANSEIVERLLKAGADAKARRPNGATAILEAARSGNPAVLKQLLAHGADPNDREPVHRQTPLMWASSDNRAAAVTVLLDAGADPNAADSLFLQHELAPGEAATPKAPTSKGGMSALHYAARQGATDVVRVLAEKGANLDQVDPDGVNALVYAALNGHTAAAAVLLEKGADPNIADAFGRTLLFCALDINKPDFFPSRPAPVVDAAMSPLDLVKLAVAKGAYLDPQITSGLPARHDQAGDDRTSVGTTPLLRAARNSDVEGVRLLLALGADPKVPTRGGVTPLLAAAGQEWPPVRLYNDDDDAVAVVRLLLASGVDINERSDQGDTALHVASNHASVGVVKFLAENGAALDARNNANRTALDVASGLGGVRGTYFDAPADDSKAKAAIATYLRAAMESKGIATVPVKPPVQNEPAPAR